MLGAHTAMQLTKPATSFAQAKVQSPKGCNVSVSQLIFVVGQWNLVAMKAILALIFVISVPVYGGMRKEPPAPKDGQQEFVDLFLQMKRIEDLIRRNNYRTALDTAEDALTKIHALQRQYSSSFRIYPPSDPLDEHCARIERIIDALRNRLGLPQKSDLPNKSTAANRPGRWRLLGNQRLLSPRPVAEFWRSATPHVSRKRNLS